MQFTVPKASAATKELTPETAVPKCDNDFLGSALHPTVESCNTVLQETRLAFNLWAYTSGSSMCHQVVALQHLPCGLLVHRPAYVAVGGGREGLCSLCKMIQQCYSRCNSSELMTHVKALPTFIFCLGSLLWNLCNSALLSAGLHHQCSDRPPIAPHSCNQTLNMICFAHSVAQLFEHSPIRLWQQAQHGVGKTRSRSQNHKYRACAKTENSKHTVLYIQKHLWDSFLSGLGGGKHHHEHPASTPLQGPTLLSATTEPRLQGQANKVDHTVSTPMVHYQGMEM